MPKPDDTEPSRLDLSDDEAFAKLVERRDELAEILKEFRQTENERKEIDQKILAKLGNAKSAIDANGAIVSTQTVKRAEFRMPALVYQKITVRRPLRRRPA